MSRDLTPEARAALYGEVTTGPSPTFTPRPHDLTRFRKIMDALQRWRSADHEDAIALTRNQIIEIIEGVRELDAAASRKGDER